MKQISPGCFLNRIHSNICQPSNNSIKLDICRY